MNTDRATCITVPYPVRYPAPRADVSEELVMVHPPSDIKDLECWAVAGEIAG